MAKADDTDIADLLGHLGVRVKSVGEREISGWCPVHAETVGREDTTPSWSISRVTGLWVCYSCHAGGNLEQLVTALTGDPNAMSSVNRIILRSTWRRIEAKAKGELLPEEAPVRADEAAYIAFEDVPRKHLNSRDIDRASADHYGIRWNADNRTWVLPIRMPNGKFLGWQEKKAGWVRNFPIGVEKSSTLFGAPQFTVPMAVILMESPLDVARLHTVGISGGLATFGSMVSTRQIDMVNDLRQGQPVIIAMDDDDAGIHAARKLRRVFGVRTRFLYYGNTGAKDIGDMTDRQIERAIDRASRWPWWRQPSLGRAS